jgi:hypothetical protein
MFGLNEITWKEFMQFTCTVLLLWYAALFLRVWIKSRSRQKNLHYEDFQEEGFQSENLHPVKVSSGSFPTGLLPYPYDNIPLEVVTYEETGEEGGYVIDEFTQNNNPALSGILKDIQYQQ